MTQPVRGFECPPGCDGHSRALDIPAPSRPPSVVSSSDAGSIHYGSPFAPANARSAFLAPSSSAAHIPPPHPSSSKHARELAQLPPPEKELTLFALRLAILEKMATTVGTLSFIWATVVILGGYAATVKEIDFWFVTVILVTEGARIFGRSHELEWQHQDTGKGTISSAYHRGSDALHKSTRRIRVVLSHLVSPNFHHHPKHMDETPRDEISHPPQARPYMRAWSASKVPIVNFTRLIFQARNVSLLWYSMQILSALLSIVLSVWRLSKRDFRSTNEPTDAQSNHMSSLIMFYSLTVFEALIFLVERAYWQYQISVKDILTSVSETCLLPPEHGYIVRRFFYDVYAKCLNEGMFQGLNMDLVDYMLQWLQADSHSEQLGAIRGLLALYNHPQFGQEILRAVGTSQGAVERLLEMVTWKNHEEQEIREGAAWVLSKLVAYDRNGIRVAAIPGSIAAIFSLLATTDNEFDDDEGSTYACDHALLSPLERITRSNKLATHVELGLRILINMARNQADCAKIGATKGLLATLGSFIEVHGGWMRAMSKGGTTNREDKIWVLSLRLLSLLASSSSEGGKALRGDIARVMSSIASLRNILNLKGDDMFNNPSMLHTLLTMQELATSTLSSMAMDSKVREVIGRTGGVFKSLFGLFLMKGMGNSNPMDNQDQFNVHDHKLELQVAIRAGEALNLLALQSRNNCWRLLSVKISENEQYDHHYNKGKIDSLSPQPSSSSPLQKIDGGVIPPLIDLMDDMYRGHLAIFILYSLCDIQLPPEYKAQVSSCMSKVLTLVMEERGRMQEAAIGLASKLIPMLDYGELQQHFLPNLSNKSLGKRMYTKGEVVSKLAKVLEQHTLPSQELPRIRFYCLQLICALLDADLESFFPLFHDQNFCYYLQKVSNTSSDMENYATFFGSIGITLRTFTMEQLFKKAIQKLNLKNQISFA